MSRRVWPFAVLGFVGVTLLGLAALPNGSAPTPEAPSSLASAPAAPETTASEATAPVLPEPTTATPMAAEAHAADAPPSEPTERAPSAAGEAVNAAEVAPKAPEESASVHVVTLEVFPLDAKVVRKGLRHPGPPYVFKVPAGKRISVEVAKKGFVTRKVVLDGSEPTVTVGLFRKSSRRPGVAAKSSGHDDSSSRVGSGL